VDRVTTIGNRQKRYRLYENDCRLVGNLPGFIINLLIGDYNIVLIDISNSNLKSVIFKIGNAFIKTIRLQGSVTGISVTIMSPRLMKAGSQCC
jgi:hypothetical protein